MIEKRRFPRVNHECPVQLKTMRGTGSNLMKNSFSKNVSQSGMELVSFDFYPVNDRVQVQVFSSSYASMMQAVGRIVWVQQLPNQEKYRIGIELVEVSRSAYRKLTSLVQNTLLSHGIGLQGDMNVA
ncbi:MAG: PilZ domain-containing protein [PVC group bacterium]|nr:PilZ domain-containing protein [PVC group bacterium]